MSTSTSTSTTQTFYKMDIQGIVYLVDPTTTIAYTYDLETPTAIGKVKWIDAATVPELILYDNWREILEAKRSATAEKVSAASPPATA